MREINCMRLNYSVVAFIIVVLGHALAVYGMSQLVTASHKAEPEQVMQAVMIPPPPKIEKPVIPKKVEPPKKKKVVKRKKAKLPPPKPVPPVPNEKSIDVVEPPASADTGEETGDDAGEYVEPEPPITPPQVDPKRPNKSPPYPRQSRKYKEEGSVVLEILILANGKVGEVRIKTSSGFPRLDKAAIQTANRWRFLPAMQEGKPISYWNLQSVKFVMN